MCIRDSSDTSHLSLRLSASCHLVPSSHPATSPLAPQRPRCFLGWQLPWAPKDAAIDPKGAGPWLRLFQNAAAFSAQHGHA